MSHISLWIAMHTSLVLIPFAISGLWSREDSWLYPHTLARAFGDWGAPVPSPRDPAHAPGPGLTLTGSWGALGGRRAPHLCRAHTLFWRTCTLATVFLLLLLLYIVRVSKALGAFEMQFKYSLKESLVQLWTRSEIPFQWTRLLATTNSVSIRSKWLLRRNLKAVKESNTILPWGQVEIKLFASALRSVDRFQHPTGRSGRRWI